VIWERRLCRLTAHNRTLVGAPEGIDLHVVASLAHYVGSPEHKDRPSFAGYPRPRADASICDPNISRDQDGLTERLRESIRAGIIGAPWEGRFPRYVWCKIDDSIFEARLVNKGSGQYKGYKLEPEQYPQGVWDNNE
jgi:hypothetical protein